MEQKAPYGIYNVCNPGGITTKQVAGMLAEKFPDEDFNFFEDYKAFENATVAPRSNCTLSSDKLLNYTTMRSAEDALLDAINKYE